MILLIDDSPEVREVLRVALESEGYSVLEAPDGREGVRLFREHRPSVTIVDIVMPEKDGIETVREILVIDPAAVVFTMSGQDEAGAYQETARILGAKHGFLKPVRIEELLGAIRHHCRTAPLRFEKTYKEGFRIIVQERGILIEAVDYHTSPLFLSEEELAGLCLKLARSEKGTRK